VLQFDQTINDQYGHAVGDRTLQIFAEIAKAHIGMPGTGADGAAMNS
jgi:GGDEF domain-containing protein